jgi:hypothetical protein
MAPSPSPSGIGGRGSFAGARPSWHQTAVLQPGCQLHSLRLDTASLLAAAVVDTSIDPIALHHHFTLHAVVPAPRTLMNGIRKLPPASLMRIDTRSAGKVAFIGAGCATPAGTR